MKCTIARGDKTQETEQQLRLFQDNEQKTAADAVLACVTDRGGGGQPRGRHGRPTQEGHVGQRGQGSAQQMKAEWPAS